MSMIHNARSLILNKFKNVFHFNNDYYIINTNEVMR